ncbi:MAG: pyrroloquinoline quinone precursor peptide PqqA [Candidatus Sulfotelmatobacter sp.]
MEIVAGAIAARDFAFGQAGAKAFNRKVRRGKPQSTQRNSNGATTHRFGLLILGARWVKLKGAFEAATLDTTWEKIMQWTAPAFEEVCLNCEINSYASAKL